MTQSRTKLVIQSWWADLRTRWSIFQYCIREMRLARYRMRKMKLECDRIDLINKRLWAENHELRGLIQSRNRSWRQ
jgi:hypothetical protein